MKSESRSLAKAARDDKLTQKSEEPASESGHYKGVLGILKLGVGVRADFAVQVDLFVLRGNPFHERGSFEEFKYRQQHSTRSRKVEEGKSGRRPVGAK